MLYLNIKDADTLKEEQYKLDVQPQSIEFNVVSHCIACSRNNLCYNTEQWLKYNHNGANYNFKISKLAKEVVPDKSRVKVSRSMTIILLYESSNNIFDSCYSSKRHKLLFSCAKASKQRYGQSYVTSQLEMFTTNS